MTSIRKIKAVANAGDVDPSAALRVDVIRAAERWADALDASISEVGTKGFQARAVFSERESALFEAVARMRRARSERA